MHISKKAISLSLAFTLAAGPIMYTGSSSAYAAAVDQQTDKSVDQVKAQEQHSSIQYFISAKLDEKKMKIEGSQTVTYRNTSNDTLKELVFHTFADANRSQSTKSGFFKRTNEQLMKENPALKPADFLGGIDIHTVKTSETALAFSNTNQALTVQLLQELTPGEAVTVQIEFEVQIPYGSGRLSHMKDIINGAHWFPVMSVYDDKTHQWDKTPYSTSFESDYYTISDFEVQFNVPDSYQVLMPGTVTVEETAEKGRKMISAIAGNTREFVFFASPNYKVSRATRDGLTIEYYYFDNEPGKEKAAEQYIDQAFRSITFFNEKFGPYPYPEFRIAESYAEGIAVEFSRVIQMGKLSPDANPVQNTVFIHEIAHQWFHALIGNNSELESFLDEGFADFATSYFAEKQGDPLNGFKMIQFDDTPIDIPIASSNTEVGDMANPVFYDKGRQAIYQLYRMVGEKKFDAFMQAYFKRYVHQNASIEGLLQTIEDVLGKQVRNEMQTALYEPNFALEPEYQMTAEERIAYFREQLKTIYHTSFAQIADLLQETMSRVIDKALQGEPLTIVTSEPASSAEKHQQKQLLQQLQDSLLFLGLQPKVISERQAIKKQLTKELAGSNLIVLGNAKSNALIQALKPGIIQRSKLIGFDWKQKMNKPSTFGAYVIKHPYNQKRLLLHYYWNDKALDQGTAKLIAVQMQKVLMFGADFYHYYEINKKGNVIAEKKTANPLAELFGE
ncbi:M1 family metallopeptidase [Paenibacillus sp. GCM10027626]|uniref:M1 family metallopeptidase n=1 Tax=Paenibacillus sp. GCM10027626 TaxID=3273411 RepID=UPI003642CFB2